MPSPFPGMDPYLEDPILWPSVHHRLIAYMGDALTAILPSRYVANIAERLSVSEPDRDIYPDASVLEDRPRPPVADVGASTAAVCDPPWQVEMVAEEVREAFIEILPVANLQQVVTIIEILSPGNKAPSSQGRQLYRAKQRQVLASPTHLLEIDLLRAGLHTVAATRDWGSNPGSPSALGITIHCSPTKAGPTAGIRTGTRA